MIEATRDRANGVARQGDRPARWGWVAILLCLAGQPWVASSQVTPDDGPPAGDSSEYDALLELLEDLPRDEEIDALKDYLERHPDSPHRREIEQRLDILAGAGDRRGSRESPPSAGLREPFSFEPVGPEHRFVGRVGLGGPQWAELLLGYDHPLGANWRVGGRAGFSEGQKLLEASGRYLALRTPRNGGILEFSLATRAALGLDSHLQLEPRAGYGGRFGPVQVETFLGWRMRLTGGFHSRLLAGVAAGVALRDDWWIGLETAGRLNLVAAERPDLAIPEPLPYLVSYFAVTAGVRHTIAPGMDLDLLLSVPDWYRYQRMYAGMVGVAFRYRFDQ